MGTLKCFIEAGSEIRSRILHFMPRSVWLGVVLPQVVPGEMGVPVRCTAPLQMPGHPEATHSSYLHNSSVVCLLGEASAPGVLCCSSTRTLAQRRPKRDALGPTVPQGLRKGLVPSTTHTKSHSGHPEADLMI